MARVPQVSDIRTWMRQVENRLRKMEQSARLRASSVGEGGLVISGGGNVTIEDGGSVFVEDNGAFTAFWPGGRPSAYFGPHENGYQGISVISDAATSDPDGQDMVFQAVRDPVGATSWVYVGDGNAPVAQFVVRAAHQFFTNLPTTSSAANVNVGSTGELLKSTSSRRYKTDIEDLDIDPDAVLRLRPRTWRDRAEIERDAEAGRETTARYPGFIAEEVAEAGCEQFVVYDEQGRPDALSYDRMPAALVLVSQRLQKQSEDQQRQIHSQQQQIEDLTARLDALEATDA